MEDMPVPARIEVDGGASVTLTWDDGSMSVFTAAELRGACQCASCREPTGQEATRLVLGGAAPVTIEDTALVGGYALSFVFGPDGHGTGIYPFVELKHLAAG